MVIIRGETQLAPGHQRLTQNLGGKMTENLSTGDNTEYKVVFGYAEKYGKLVQLIRNLIELRFKRVCRFMPRNMYIVVASTFIFCLNGLILTILECAGQRTCGDRFGLAPDADMLQLGTLIAVVLAAGSLFFDRGPGNWRSPVWTRIGIRSQLLSLLCSTVIGIPAIFFAVRTPSLSG
jgi:hypothetical protein